MCWIVWIFDLNRNSDRDLPKEILKLLKGNKNRGQEWYGISVLTEAGDINTYKFQDIYDTRIYEALSDTKDKIIWIIWHARYPTSWWKSQWDEYIQPFDMKELDSKMAFAFNGNIANADDLGEEMNRKKFSKIFSGDILDTKVLEKMILDEVANGERNTSRISENIHNQIDGSCNMILMSWDGDFTLSKDRWWFRPLSIVEHEVRTREKTERMVYFSSESSALVDLWFNDNDIKGINTWESIKYNPKSKELIKSKMDLDLPLDKSRCFFETVYFADRNSRIWWEASNTHRYRLGQTLAKNDHNYFHRDDSIVVDVPASSRDTAEWFAKELDLPLFSTAITKNPLFDKRAFIWANPEERKKILESKYIFNPDLKPLIKWKKIVLVDDSIVRGSTLDFLINKIKEFYEPSEVHIRIPSPPIIGPCYYAINLKNPNELIARKFFKDPNQPEHDELEKLATHLWGDSLRFINKEELIDSLRVDVKDMCLWCITWKYPTPKWRQIFKDQIKKESDVSQTKTPA